VRRRDIRDALDDAVDLALAPAARIDGVLVAGDLFDRPDPDAELLEFVRGCLARLHSGGKPTVLLPGLFDAVEGPRVRYASGDPLPGVTLVDWETPRRIEMRVGDETLHLYSFAWSPGRSTAEIWGEVRREEGLGGLHVGLFHADLDGEVVPGSPLPSVAAADLAASGLDLVVVGRNHEAREMTVGGTTVVCPGSPVGLTFGEWNERCFVVAVLSEGRVTVERRVRSVAPVIETEVDLAEAESADEEGLISLLRERLTGIAMARVRLVGETSRPLDLERVAGEIGENGVVLDLIDATLVGDDAANDGDGSSLAAVRRLFADRLRRRIAAAPEGEAREVLKEALRIGLERMYVTGGRHAA